MYPGFDNGPTETYMMPGTGPNPQLTIVPPPEEFDYMGNEVPPEVVYDQGLYYPAANYYGYICTGLDPQSEWNDHHRFFGLDGQEIHYSGFQADSYPYVYYPPSYGYTQSSYNPYNPYIPGAVIGVDSPIIGTEQYFSNPSYQLPVSSPTNYMPVVVSPHSDAVPPSSVSHSSFGTGSSVPPSRHCGAGSKYSQPRVSSNGGTASQGAASRLSVSESSPQVSTDVSLSKQPSSLMTSGNITQMTQGRTSSGLIQVTDHFSHGSVSTAQNPPKVASNSPLPNYGTSVRGWSIADRFTPRFQLNGAGRNANGSPDVLGEQNRGPRTNKSKGQLTSAISAQTSNVRVDNTQEAIVIRADQYNRDCFSVDYPDAKFFVIKSYSEDDVHKSIKYNVWSSTPNGNKRLHSAYEDAQKRSCPIFLFFSVNASGQFCGVAEMIGQVDFHKDMDFWQQDKWTGSFPVKWHIIKDVPNTSFRHIVLENNENKPVTNSRDTQEMTYIPGMNMLNIFKSSPLTTSILDDFMFYEERQKIMQEEKSRFIGSSFNSYIPAIVSPSEPVESPKKFNSVDNSEVGDQSSVMSDQSLKADGNQHVDDLLTPNAMPASLKLQKSSDCEGLIIEPSNDKKNVNPDKKEDNISTAINKMNSLSIGSKEGSIETVVIEESTQTDVSRGSSTETDVIENGTKTNVVTVGTMHIKVNGTDEPSSRVI